eukprot:SAG11_NODE_416_length_9669_cov_7.135528_14_plen_39_part_00
MLCVNRAVERGKLLTTWSTSATAFLGSMGSLRVNDDTP